MSPLFSDHMVLQRGKTNPVWGWAKPGENIRVEIEGKTAAATAGADGRWQAAVVPPPAGGPYTLKISGPQIASLTDVLVGDVWICGGQSNMEFELAKARGGEAEVNAADCPNIRLFNVAKQVSYVPSAAVSGTWKVCSPETVTEDGGVSAVGYFFARKIQTETKVPIGLIKDCWGGTPAESWASAESLRLLKDFGSTLDEVARLHAKGGEEYGNFVSHWYDEYDAAQKNNAWAAVDLDEGEWKKVVIPGGFAELGVPSTPALCYFRKTVVLPDPLPAGGAKILLGAIEKMDTTFINGRWIGASAWSENPRAYDIGGGVLKVGPNVITVRVFKTKPAGGFLSEAGQLKLVLGDKTEIPLAGDWKGRLSVDAKPPHPLPLGFENWPTMPGVLHNGMIAPVAPFAISGALWYQGEANADRAAQYRKLLPAMIGDWRKAFGQGDFPFYIVSLASFMPHRDVPGDGGWAELREAQDFTARSVKNSGLALAIDLGDANDIHPKDKKEVGDRLALLALAGHYGKNVTSSGPRFVAAEKIPGALKLRFDQSLVVKGDRLEEFAIAGDDHKWHSADATIEGDSVVVSSPDVPGPAAARYAWQSNPRATLYNTAGLPAVPFRTDAPLAEP
ncbi:MAG: sialate O-acetylesterase [Luteolibacter sp.]